MDTRTVILVATSAAAGALGTYAAGEATAVATVATSRPETIELALAERQIADVRSALAEALDPVLAANDIPKSDLCSLGARVMLAFDASTDGECRARGRIGMTLPGEWVPNVAQLDPASRAVAPK